VSTTALLAGVSAATVSAGAGTVGVGTGGMVGAGLGGAAGVAIGVAGSALGALAVGSLAARCGPGISSVALAAGSGVIVLWADGSLAISAWCCSAEGIMAGVGMRRRAGVAPSASGIGMLMRASGSAAATTRMTAAMGTTSR
jgi:hypothetical protein